MARLLPTARVRRCVPPMPGMTPSVISGCAARRFGRCTNQLVLNWQVPDNR